MNDIVEALRHMGLKPCDEAADEIERLRKQLNAAREDAVRLGSNAKAWQKQCASAQAREAKLLLLMKEAAAYFDGDRTYMSKDTVAMLNKMYEAAALPQDDTALRERLRAERERVALAVEDKFDFCGDEIVIADTIRALEDEK